MKEFNLELLKKLLLTNTGRRADNPMHEFIGNISRHYPISHSFIDKHQDLLYWHFISINENIKFNYEFISKYKSKLDGQKICLRKDIYWSERMINLFVEQYKWNSNSDHPITIWYYLSGSKYFPWSEEIIEEKKDYFRWSSLSSNNSLPWSFELITKFKNKWDWLQLSQNENIPWDINLLNRYKSKWSWSCISRNKSIPWSKNLVNKYKNVLRFYQLLENPNVPWTKELLEEHQTLIDKQREIDIDKRIESIEHTNKYRDWEDKVSEDEVIVEVNEEWDDAISSAKLISNRESPIEKVNPNFRPISKEELIGFPSKGWEYIIRNPNAPLTEKMVENCFKKLKSWEDKGSILRPLSKNSNFPWSIEFVLKYVNFLSWPHLGDNIGFYNTLFKNLHEDVIDELFEFVLEHK